MNVTLFRSKHAWTDKSSVITFQDLVNFQKTGDLSILANVDYNSIENYISYRAQKALESGEFRDTEYIPFLKERKKMSEYLKEGIYKLPKDKLSEKDFTQVLDYDMSVVANTFRKGKYELIKSVLPAHTVCSYNKSIKTGKDKQHITGHHGLIVIDIDNELTFTQKEFIKSLQPYAILPSTSGNWRPYFRIDVSEKSIKRFGGISNLHEAYWDNFDRIFREKEIFIDESCSNVNRLTFISPNTEFADYYIDEEAPEIKAPNKEDLVANKSYKELKKSVESLDDDTAPEILKPILVKELDSLILDCQQHNYQPMFDGSNMYSRLRNFNYSFLNILGKDDTITYLCKLLSLTKLDERVSTTSYINRGYDYIINEFYSKEGAESPQSWKYIFTLRKDVEDFISKKIGKELKIKALDEINSFLSTLPKNSFYHLLAKDLSMKSSLDGLNNYLTFVKGSIFSNQYFLSSESIYNWHKDFMRIRIDAITDDFEINGYKPKVTDPFNNNSIFKTITANFKAFRTEGERGLVSTCKYNIEDYFSSPQIEYFNAPMEYFESLSRTDSLSEVNKAIDIFNQTSLNNCGTKFVDWCFGVIKNAISDSFYDRILYLYSSKGAQGKTFFINHDILPKQLQYLISSDFTFNVENKDDKLKITENLILIDDEGSSTSRRSDDTKKAISSKKNVKEREAFAKRKSNKNRIASIVSCTNNNEISSSSNIDRRSLICHLPNTKWQDSNSFVMRWRKDIDIDLFWSQLYSLYLRDNNFMFITDDEIVEDTASWKQENQGTDLIDTWLRVPGKGEKYEIMSHIQIKSRIQLLADTDIKLSLNSLLKTKGFEHVTKSKCPTSNDFKSGYKVVFKNVTYLAETPTDLFNDIEQSGEHYREAAKNYVRNKK